MTHREFIKEYLSHITLKDLSVIDWGSGTKPASRYIKHEGCKFLMVDKLAHVGADIICDITEPLPITDFDTDLYDVAFCMEVLEHVEYPTAVVKNIRAYLKPGGLFFFSVPFMFPIHSDEDYWRFTNQGLNLLLERTGFKVMAILATPEDQGWVGKAIKQ